MMLVRTFRTPHYTLEDIKEDAEDQRQLTVACESRRSVNYGEYGEYGMTIEATKIIGEWFSKVRTRS